MDYVAQLKSLTKEHEFFIGFDSDGCVFDSMEIKQKECFCPAVIKHYGLQRVSKYAREVWEFVNLYSKTRGCNRFLAVQRTMELLAARKEVQGRGGEIPALSSLRAWTQAESKLSNDILQKQIEATGDEELKKIMAWSLEVNERIQDLVFGLPPFPGVEEVLAASKKQADVIVVSQTPLEALEREWHENNLQGYIKMIAGQEHGTKTEHLAIAAAGRYDSDKILMVGDAPGDLKAAKANEALFYPIIPGTEEQSWERFAGEALQRFFDGTYAGAYQQKLIDEFDRALPAEPSW